MIRELLHQWTLSGEERGAEIRRQMEAAGERYIQWQRELLLENPNDPPQFWRWKR